MLMAEWAEGLRRTFAMHRRNSSHRMEGGWIVSIPTKKKTALYGKAGKQENNIFREKQQIQGNMIRPNGLEELSWKMMVLRLM